MIPASISATSPGVGALPGPKDSPRNHLAPRRLTTDDWSWYGHGSLVTRDAAEDRVSVEPSRSLATCYTKKGSWGKHGPPRKSRSALPSRGRRRCGSRSAPRSRAGRRTASSIPRSHFALFQKYLPGTTRRSGPPCSGVSGSPSACVASRASGSSRNEERRVGGVALLGVGDREARGRLRRDELRERAPGNALERRRRSGSSA